MTQIKNYSVLLILLFLSGMLTLKPSKLYSQPQKATIENTQAKDLIINKHKNQICSFTHKFVYLVTADLLGTNLSIALVKDGASHYSAWVPDSNINVVTATAYMADQNGHCITSRYAAEPWNNAYDQTLLKNVFSEQLGIPKEAITVSGMSVQLQLKWGNKTGIGMPVPNTDEAVINERWLLWKDSLQQKVIHTTDTIIPLISIETESTIKRDSKIYLCGYSQENTAVYASLQFISEPLIVKDIKDNRVQFTSTRKILPEGAPVFNEQGDFSGIYSGINNKSENPSISLISIHPIK